MIVAGAQNFERLSKEKSRKQCSKHKEIKKKKQNQPEKINNLNQLEKQLVVVAANEWYLMKAD